ncbi:MAG: phosphatidate cytidylyltransferase [Planctomycetota bacterium]
MLKKRIIPASIIIAIISALFYSDYHFQSKVGFTLLLSFVAMASLMEFYGMYKNIGIKTPKIIPIVIIVGWLILSTFFFTYRAYSLIPVFLSVFLLTAMIYYIFHINNYPHIFVYIIGFIYVFVPIICSFAFYDRYGLSRLIYVIAIIKIADSLAYFGGNWLGKHKLAPTISPNKTVEGFIIGILGGALSGFLLCYIMGNNLGLPFMKLAIFLLLILPSFSSASWVTC